MMELTLDRLPGGDASRRCTIARITLTNSGEGLGGVRVYDVKVVQADETTKAELQHAECRSHREVDEGTLRLAYRALGRMLGEHVPRSHQHSR